MYFLGWIVLIETARGIPDFDENGNLPHKCYEVTLDEIKEKLVDNFPNSRTRRSRYECFMKFYKELTTNVKSCIRLLIDGSFVTNKENPRDVDFVIIIDSLKLTKSEKNYLEEILFKKDSLKKEFLQYEQFVELGMLHEDSLYNLRFYKMGCDFFQVIKYNHSHLLYENYTKELDAWIRWWGHQRDNTEKGFLNLPVNYGGI